MFAMKLHFSSATPLIDLTSARGVSPNRLTYERLVHRVMPLGIISFSTGVVSVLDIK